MIMLRGTQFGGGGICGSSDRPGGPGRVRGGSGTGAVPGCVGLADVVGAVVAEGVGVAEGSPTVAVGDTPPPGPSGGGSSPTVMNRMAPRTTAAAVPAASSSLRLVD
jgi:hypothetical protein